ncbi:MAG: DNA primase [Tissierellia bacterium]|nr:DNA primase [Tissierellia bacterium]
MARIPEDKIQEVKDQMDIVSIVSEYVDLKKSGQNFVGLCPFHNEKTPSFTVSSQKGIFRCFGCGEGGDVIGFIMKKENLSYPEAIRFLADKGGIFIETGQFDQKAYQQRNKLLAINEEAKQYFFRQLLVHKTPREYLVKRGLDRRCINEFVIGYADGSGTGLYRHLKDKGYEEKDMLELGLIGESTFSKGYYDKYRDRLIFPILDIKKKVIGFGGRTLVDHPAKYINSKDSKIYNKSLHIYGVGNLNEIAKKNKVLLVEGYMDVIALFNKGIDYAVASLGTALTKEQGKLIKRYTENVYICYDGDEAGQKATDKAIKIFHDLEIGPRIIEIPGGQDPDDYIKAYGAEAFQNLEEKAKDPILYQYGKLKKKYNVDIVQEKVKLVDEMAKILAQIDRPILRDEYSERIAQSLGIRPEALQDEIRKKSRNKQKLTTKNKDTNLPNMKQREQRKQRIIIYEAIRFMIFNPESRNSFKDYGEMFQKNFTLWEDLVEYFNQSKLQNHRPLKEEMDEEFPKAKKIIQYLYRVDDPSIYQGREYLEKFIQGLVRQSLVDERERIVEEIEILDFTDCNEKLREKQRELLQKLNEIDKKLKRN